MHRKSSDMTADHTHGDILTTERIPQSLRQTGPHFSVVRTIIVSLLIQGMMAPVFGDALYADRSYGTDERRVEQLVGVQFKGQIYSKAEKLRFAVTERFLTQPIDSSATTGLFERRTDESRSETRFTTLAQRNSQRRSIRPRRSRPVGRRRSRRIKPNMDLARIVARAKNNTTLVLGEGTYTLKAQKPYAQGVFIGNKRGLTITGQGPDKTTVKLPSDVDVGFWVGSNIKDLVIEKLRIVGTPPLKTNTAAIGNGSGTTNVKNVTFRDLRIERVAVGISVVTSKKGIYEDVTITGNVVNQTVGTEAGWGYGIHSSGVGNLEIFNNLVNHAKRHSIYVRDAPAGTSVSIENNLIVNHDLNDENPRWYCAALNCGGSRAKTRIAHNIFLNPHAVGIAVMTTGKEVVLLNNQIVGEHYVGIWMETGEPHLGFGNTVLLDANPKHPEWAHTISSFDWPNGRPTKITLNAPDSRWTKWDHLCELEGTLFVMNEGMLDKISPGTWKYETCPRSWKQVKGICTLRSSNKETSGRIYVLTEAGLDEVNPENWDVKHHSGDWSGARYVTATTDAIHILKDGILHSVSTEDFEIKSSEQRWDDARWMMAWNDRIYVLDGDLHYRVDPATLKGVVISQNSRP